MKNHLCVLSIIERVKKVGLLDQPFFVFLIIVDAVCIFHKIKKEVDGVCIRTILKRFIWTKTTRYKQFTKNINQYFSNPIIHKEINGDKIYVALDLDRIWNRIN